MLRVALLVPDGFATLSFAPLAVFEVANAILEEPFYEVHVVSATGGRLANSFGMAIETECVTDATFDTLLVGSPPDLRTPSPQMLSFLRRALNNTRRIASICVGAFILGEAGLLDGRRATTHWLFAKDLQRRYPKATVEVDRIFITWHSVSWSATLVRKRPATLPERSSCIIAGRVASPSTRPCWNWMPNQIVCRRRFCLPDVT